MTLFDPSDYQPPDPDAAAVPAPSRRAVSGIRAERGETGDPYGDRIPSLPCLGYATPAGDITFRATRHGERY
jgi:hypothetical protein